MGKVQHKKKGAAKKGPRRSPRKKEAQAPAEISDAPRDSMAAAADIRRWQESNTAAAAR